MKQSLPWNVTGIPAEARELARAAAAREGLSVGDWLTRRILAEQAARAAAEPVQAPAPVVAPFRVERVGEARRERDEPGLRPARSEAEGDVTFRRSEDSAFRRIDETLRALARRIEAAERSQHDANRAMGAAAAEINAATREHAGNFQQLSDRIDAVERGADSSSLRDAVKALHQGLSRLAEQIAQTANESNSKIAGLSGTIQQTASEAGSKIASLASTVEAMNGTVAKTREDATRASRDVGEKVNALALRLKHSDERQDAMESRVLATESRLENEDARIQEALGKHLSAIERNLDGIAARLDQSEKTRSDADNSVNEVLRGLNGKFETADKRTRDAMTELRTHLTELGKRLDGVESDSPGTPGLAAMPMSFAAAPSAPMASPMSSPLAAPIFDEPEEEPAPSLQSPPPPASLGADFDLPPFPEEPPLPGSEFSPASALDADAVPPPPAPFEEAFPDATETRAAPQDYIAAARRAAKAAAEAEAQRKGRSSVLPPRGAAAEAKTPNAPSKAKPKQKVPRLAAAAVLVVVVSALGFLLARVFSPFGESGAVIETAGVEGPQVTTQVQLPPVQGPQVVPPAPAQTQTVDVQPQAPVAAPATAALGQPPAAAPRQQAAARPGAPVLDRLTARANAGSADAALLLGLKYIDGDGVTASDAEGVRWLTRAAGQGEALAQYRLGTLFERGRGVTQDPRQAFHWYEQSAKAGNRKAMHNLAVAYADGAGTEKNFTQAVTWFRTAADLGLVDSQFNLAVLYERGMGVPESLTEAYKWYLIASGQGDAESKTRVEALQTQLQPAQRATAERAAAAFRAKAMDNEANEPPTLAQAAP